MSIDGSKKDALDDFWDISKLVPEKKKSYTPAPTARVSNTAFDTVSTDKNAEEPSTVIKRYVSPNAAAQKLHNEREYRGTETYSPDDSLVHLVTVKWLVCKYNYYNTFLNDAVRYMRVDGEACEYVPFFSYLPQYDQMNASQRAYYFWFRSSVLSERYIKTDYGYLFLLIYEIINLGKRLDTSVAQKTLTSLWNEYRTDFPAINSKLAMWICDYSFIHHLPPPDNASPEMIRSMPSLGEFYVKMPKGDMMGCARTLMKYCSSYDYRTSKFAVGENAEIFDTHIIRGLCEALLNYDEILARLGALSGEDSLVERDAYVGALVSYEQRCRIEVRYCSFSRSNELRFLVGDVIKYCENKIRGHIGVKSKMTVYSVNADLKRVLDRYFEENLPPVRAKRSVERKEEYEVLYDTPKKKLSLTDALRIEEESWQTTEELVSAFDDDGETDSIEIEEVVRELRLPEAERMSEDPFAEYRNVIKATMLDPRSFSAFARDRGILTDALIDRINEIAYEEIGDVLIEDDGEGNCSVIEDYRYLFE